MKALIVSSALDTNGQNFRYAEAARRWGEHDDVLKALIAGLYDPADVAGRFREAANKLGGLAIRTAHSTEAYFDFPRDIRWNPRGRRGHEGNALVQQLAAECDVIHLNNSDAAYRSLKMWRYRKPALLHHHGTLFRNNPTPLLATAKRYHMVQAVSTVDLKRAAPDLLHWLPTAYDLDAMAAIRAEHRRPDDGRVRVVSCPTNRAIKSTDALEAAVAQLQAEGLPIDLVVVTGERWADALALKATADIYFDQVGLGYGCNAIEAWGMGIPVVAGADPWTLATMRSEWGLKKNQPLPFHEATEATIADALRELVESADLRSEVAARGAAHAAKYHAERPALARLAELYGMAIRRAAEAPTSVWGEYRVGPGTFVTERKGLQVRLGSQSVTFVDGMVRVDDPQQAERLRRIAMMRTRFKIRELLDEEVVA